MNRLLDLFHVYSSRQIEILIKKVTVPVLFSGPCPCPSCPWAGACPCFITNSISDIDLCLVSWKGFFSDHISNQNNKVVIRGPCSSLTRSWNPSDAGSGRRSWGCQHFSTGFRWIKTFSSTQFSMDLKISILCGGIEWVTCTLWGELKACLDS